MKRKLSQSRVLISEIPGPERTPERGRALRPMTLSVAVGDPSDEELDPTPTEERSIVS